MGCDLPAAVVIDVETTGIGKKNRIIEIALISLAPKTWDVTDEFDTLINPERDVGPVGVHGITASMVSLAPTFEGVAGAILRRLDGRILIAHNLPFDYKFIKNELLRYGVDLNGGNGFCTLKKTRMKLPHACGRYGIDLGQHHRALADARATVKLSRILWERNPPPEARPVQTPRRRIFHAHRTMRRGLAANDVSPMHRIVALANYPDCDEAVCCYLDALDWFLDDGVLDGSESAGLAELARELGLSEAEQRESHREYIQCIIEAAQRDKIITEREHNIIAMVVEQLGMSEDVEIPDVNDKEHTTGIEPGTKVCFTGEAVVDGKKVERCHLETVAVGKGMQPVRSVTKKCCDLLVAADTATSSIKAKNARKWGIAIISAEEFLNRCHGRSRSG